MVRSIKPIKFHGAKGYLARPILAHFPPRASYRTYLEPYLGSGAVFFAHDPAGKAEVLNDRDGRIVNFFRVLQQADTFATFQRRIASTPFSRAEFVLAQHRLAAGAGDPVERAADFFVVARQSLAGRLEDFAPLTRTRLRRGMNEQVSAWLSAVDNLPAVHARLLRVVLECDDALAVLRRLGDPQTVAYCDPPYLPQTRSDPGAYGAFEMTLAEHEALLRLLVTLRARILLSGYHSELYDDFLVGQHGWRVVDIEQPLHSAKGAVKQRKTEALWLSWREV